MNKELMKGSIDILLLSLISQRDMYGYEMVKRLKESSDDLYNMSEGTLYPALKRLEKQEWVTSYWSETDKGTRRKYYHITDKGQEELVLKLKDWQAVHRLIGKTLGGTE
ncbi:PadR family transcriptional regulator [Rossellomorea vietnamensis]|uniref:PadR family transcriptional regulator n=1 Tax=Rossellomorea vietnamensis TaxID=218284 RepID=A0A5D4KG18_9BACI|nr:PadR family transcriptional regulator [Rossellomorea vietnamensis]TYR75770.1 PadR family transcriptional regulator [Rossellomorea vietnamensis]